ncbi:rRNA maturation RNase YbeY [Wenzhouxiangella sp. XN24]|uniref:rRNA maturation RNase YbeY n=1 Tax=Wenzhouxiangella sp. XN24 TaxID=2713569 RepID=UPI0013EB1D85|nr:rRNA maturation RNase YbeY [Wenzhouxiangella sp. XN24]NGX14757.1 rRNA maturation RNase YbeY [Wenzhouxiangella sp. XN24]
MTLRIDIQVAGSRSGLPDVARLRHWARSALAGRRTDAELSIRIVDAAESQALNRRFRGKDRPTNVLAFPAELPPDLGLPLLGDLVICRDVVEAEAAEQAKPPHAHWAHMVIHGTLHLVGFDHETEEEAGKMEAAEAEILGELGWPDPYRETEGSND